MEKKGREVGEEKGGEIDSDAQWNRAVGSFVSSNRQHYEHTL